MDHSQGTACLSPVLSHAAVPQLNLRPAAVHSPFSKSFIEVFFAHHLPEAWCSCQYSAQFPSRCLISYSFFLPRFEWYLCSSNILEQTSMSTLLSDMQKIHYISVSQLTRFYMPTASEVLCNSHKRRILKFHVQHQVPRCLKA